MPQLRSATPEITPSVSAKTTKKIEFFILKEERSIVFIAFTVMAIALGSLYQKWQRHIAIRDFKQQHGCNDLPIFPRKDKS